MSSLPLHPAIVHLPLGLALIMPALTVGFAWALWRGRVRPRAWLTVIALQGVLLAGGLVAMNTGGREEDRVEAVVPEVAIGRHEEYAEQFVWATGVTLALAGMVLVLRTPTAARAVTLATVAGTLVVFATAMRVGHAGGQLVYAHNAGAAYASTAPNASAEPRARGDEVRRHADDDER